MNYKRIHDLIIERAKHRPRPSCYCERHHIVPRSMGGNDDADNIAVLTAREHFIIHWLLWKIHRNKQMTYAFFAMTKPVGNGRERYTSRSFAYAREAMASWIRENMSGRNSPSFGRTPHNKGIPHSAETRKKISAAASLRGEGWYSRNRPIRNLDTGQVFQTIKAAQRAAGKGNVAYAARNGGTANGCRYAFVDAETSLSMKGYASGDRHPLSRKVQDVGTGEIYQSVRQAAKAKGISGTAISIAIKEGRECKGTRFSYV